MNSQEVLKAFREDTPVKFGDLVFSRIESIIYKRARYNQYIESNTLDGVPTRVRVTDTIKIIQAVCTDQRGSDYILNPLRLEVATPEEVNVHSTVDHTLQERLKLLEPFYKWCEEQKQAADPVSLIVFLFAEDLINAGKAYDLVKSFSESHEELTDGNV